MTTLDIAGYRTYAVQHQLWSHVILCDRALGDEASILAMHHLGDEASRPLKYMPQAMALHRLQQLLDLNKEEGVTDPAEQRIVHALQTLGEEHTPPPGWEKRILATIPLTRWQRFKAWLLRGFRTAP